MCGKTKVTGMMQQGSTVYGFTVKGVYAFHNSGCIGGQDSKTVIHCASGS
jgi:hypothetical protein